LAENDQVSAEVSGEDAAGNAYSADAARDYGVDTDASATISIDTIAGDDVINGEEATQTISVTGSVGGDAKAGDTVTLTVGDNSYEGTVGEDLTYAIDVPGSVLAENDSVTAEVTGSDAAGNAYSADAARDYGVDTDASATISIDTIAGDDVINGEEATQTISVTGSVGGDAKAGDTVTLTVGDNSYEGTVGEDLTYAIDIPGSVLAENDQVSAEVSGEDAAGNAYSADAARDYGVDTDASATISIDTIAGDDVINGEEATQTISVTGSVGGDAKAGDTVTLTVGDNSYEGTVGEDLTYAIDIPGSVLAENDSVSAEVTGEDAAGNAYSADAARDYGVDAAPEAAGGQVTGEEDTALILKWSDFNITDDSPAAEQGIVISQLPSSGTLEFKDASGQWQSVAEDASFSRAEIDAGQLRFMPTTNESGFDSYGGEGVGNQAADYAQLQFLPTDAQNEGTEATLTIDIRPVADAPTVSVSLGNTLESVRASVITVEHGNATITIEGTEISAAGISGQVIKPPFSDGNLNPGSANNTNGADVIALTGDFNKLVNGNQAVNSINGDDKDYIYLNKALTSYAVNLGEQHQNSGYDGTITDLATGVTISVNNIRGIIFGDGSSMLPSDATTTITQTGYDIIEVELSALLTDTDGSEVLSDVILTDIPAGVVLTGEGVVSQSDGSWLVTNPTGDSIDQLMLTMKVPVSVGAFDITATVTSSEIYEDAAGDQQVIDSETGTDTTAVEQYNIGVGSPGGDTITGTSANDIIIGDVAGLQLVPGENYNLAFMVDTSGSMSNADIANAKASLTEVFNTLKESVGEDNAGTVNIFLVEFDTQAGRNVSVDLSDPQALSKLQAVLDGFQKGGGTNYEDVFKTTANWFYTDTVQENAGTNLTYFITDGLPTYYQRYEQTTVRVASGFWVSDQHLNISSIDYQPGQSVSRNIGGQEREVVDQNGNVYEWSQNFFGGWSKSSNPIGQVNADGEGAYEISVLGGNGSSTTQTVVHNSSEAFALLEGMSSVNAIGLGNELNENSLQSYDSDGIVQSNIDPEQLADAILGQDVQLQAGDDTISGVEGDDILFGDQVTFAGIEGNGLPAIKAYIAGQLGIADPNQVSAEQIHQYISDNHGEFNNSTGTGGNDTLIGGDSDDILFAQGGNDTLNGGAGDDIMYGGAGADTFAWEFGDQGTTDQPAMDQVMDFTQGQYGTDENADRLDLSDLLKGEDSSEYIFAEEDGAGNIVLNISSQGSPNGADQKIALEGTSFSDFGVNNGEDLIAKLIADGQLKIDQ
ncbi:Ig-like domain-containing protein, partial [Halomonas sp. SpR1]|uniref:Ig-like domain-containing protein n=1 Tax=Halomonas sp. SpR1 TaxID=3050462 RepID=UPI0027E52C2D